MKIEKIDRLTGQVVSIIDITTFGDLQHHPEVASVPVETLRCLFDDKVPQVTSSFLYRIAGG